MKLLEGKKMSITIDNIEKMGDLDLLGLGKCLCAVGNLPIDCRSSRPEFVGYNPNSGYVYVVLENGLSILSMMNNEVEYMVYDDDTEEEVFFETIEDYIKEMQAIQNKQNKTNNTIY